MLVLRRQVLPLRRVDALHGRVQGRVVVVVLPRRRLRCTDFVCKFASGSAWSAQQRPVFGFVW